MTNETTMNPSTVGPTMASLGVGSPSVGVIAYFSFCLFMANGVVSCLGFGMAMSFLFFYHIGELAGIMEDKCCNLRVAVFLQTLSFAFVMPILMWKVRLKKYLRADLVIGMLPMTFAGSPVGAILQDYTPLDILKVVVGILTLIVVAKQFHANESFRSCLSSLCGKGKKDEGNPDVEGKPNPQLNEGYVDDEGKSPSATNEDEAAKTNGTVVEDGKKSDEKDNSPCISGDCLKEIGKKMLAAVWPLRPIFFCMMIAGFSSGLLGGLIGTAGIPLIFFFLVFEYPKKVIKANGIFQQFVNIIVRIITYIVRAPPEDYPHDSWFSSKDIYLYVFVILLGLVAVPIGLWLVTRINQDQFKIGLCFLLFINAITMIVIGGMSLAAKANLENSVNSTLSSVNSTI